MFPIPFDRWWLSYLLGLDASKRRIALGLKPSYFTDADQLQDSDEEMDAENEEDGAEDAMEEDDNDNSESDDEEHDNGDSDDDEAEQEEESEVLLSIPFIPVLSWW